VSARLERALAARQSATESLHALAKLHSRMPNGGAALRVAKVGAEWLIDDGHHCFAATMRKRDALDALALAQFAPIGRGLFKLDLVAFDRHADIMARGSVMRATVAEAVRS